MQFRTRTMLLTVSLIAVLVATWGPLAANCEEPQAIGKPDIVAAFEQRLELLKNIYFECETKTEVYEDENGKKGKLIESCPVQRFKYWQLGESNRQESTFLTPSDNIEVKYGANFDADVGKGATRSISGDGKHTMGVINSVRDKTMNANRYRFWLNIRGWGLGESEYIFPYVIDNQDTLRLAGEEDSCIKIVTDYVMPFLEQGSGERVLWLDPRKGLLPIRGEFKWNHRHLDTDRYESFTVSDSVKVSGIWVPTKIDEHTLVHLPDGSGIHNFNSIKVVKIEQGDVKKADLKLNFPPDTEYTDNIKGVYYIGDENWNPTGPVTPFGQVAPLATSPPAAATRRIAMLLTFAFTIVIAILMLKKRISTHRKSLNY